MAENRPSDYPMITLQVVSWSQTNLIPLLIPQLGISFLPNSFSGISFFNERLVLHSIFVHDLAKPCRGLWLTWKSFHCEIQQPCNVGKQLEPNVHIPNTSKQLQQRTPINSRATLMKIKHSTLSQFVINMLLSQINVLFHLHEAQKRGNNSALMLEN